jgi:uncharacterized RDD family membrane protein YckC
MSAAVEPRRSESRLDSTAEDEEFVGAVTRAVSWILDAVLINVVAIITGLGTALVLSIFPLAKNLKPAFEVVAGAVYVLWAGAYFVVFWSIAGQTPGARIMQIRLLTGTRGRVRPVRAVIRWVGMNLAMLPLFAGYYPLLFRRRGFPDWLARTEVVEAPQLSLAEARRESLRAAAPEVPGDPASASSGTEG